MNCMHGKVSLFLFFICLPVFLNSATLDLKEDNKTLVFNITFTDIYEILNEEKRGSFFIIKVKSNEQLDISKEFWGLPIERVTSKPENNYYIITFEFANAAFTPKMERKDNRLVISANMGDVIAVSPESGTTNVYLRVFIGLVFIVIFILFISWLLKITMRYKITSTIPGVGRNLGRIDLIPGKTLFFYELGRYIYIIGVSGDSITLVDKVVNEDEINIIKGGFSKRREFSSYFRFFSKNNIKDDLEFSTTVIEEKLDSLRKK